MRMSRAALAALVLTTSSIVGLGVTTGPALADSHQTLPIDSFNDLAVDGPSHRIFISDGWNDKIIATDYQGTVVDEVTIGSVRHLTVIDGQLYAPIAGETAIAVLDPATLDEIRRYELGADVYPDQVVKAGGKLWFTYSEGDRTSFGSVDPVDSTVYVRPPVNSDGFSDATPSIYSSPAAPDTIVLTGSQYTNGASLTVYDVSSGQAVQTARIFPGRGAAESAVTADGTHLIRVTGQGEKQVSLADLSDGLVYPSYARANGVDVGADGRVAISVANQTTGDDVYVFEAGSATVAQTIRLPEGSRPPVPGSGEPSRDGLLDRGIAWEPDGDRLFGVARYDGVYRIWVIDAP